MKILFVSTVPVFPPSDGVRIPPANYILGLARTHKVDFLLLDQQKLQASFESDCEQTRKEVRQFWRLPVSRRPKLWGLVREMLAFGPYYGHWKLDEELPAEMTQKNYDAVFACTPASIAIFSTLTMQAKLAGKPRWIAAISDIHSLVISQLAQNSSKNHRFFARALQKVVYGLRSRALAVSEMAMLSQFDHHLVQSDKEVDWVQKNGTSSLCRRTVCLSNAVDDSLFTLPTERSEKKIAFVGLLSALYAGRFEWFIHNVWKSIDSDRVGLSLTAIGRGATESLRQSMNDNAVSYVEFVENLSDIYRDHDILVAPIFKGFGLINKVVEAMAAGCVVVGDATAFNGIPEFVAGKHGFVADTAEEFQAVLKNELANTARLNEMRCEARALMGKHFRWSQRIERIEQTVLRSQP